MKMGREKQLRLMLREIVSAATRRPNADGTIQPRDWEHQLVPTTLLQKAEELLAAELPPGIKKGSKLG